MVVAIPAARFIMLRSADVVALASPVRLMQLVLV